MLLMRTGNNLDLSSNSSTDLHNNRELSFADILAIISIILAILVPIWQKFDSDETEARLTSEIRNSEERQNARMLALQKLIEQALVTTQPQEIGSDIFIVLSRSTHVRTYPQNGSSIVATVFPNQQITLLSERGKWIEIHYFDWIAQEIRHGWILKKYALRVEKRNPQSKNKIGKRDDSKNEDEILKAIALSNADIAAGRFIQESADQHIQRKLSVK
ncbi:hypothetical protein [Undibacterium sp. Tian12W]|uniref:hypothetical protein n=1 Tax=Undibacterium sp. Tian12W TaxID=3413054 RepID=UPI003BF0B0DA